MDCQIRSDETVYHHLNTLEQGGLIRFDEDTESMIILSKTVDAMLDLEIADNIYDFICESINRGVYPSLVELTNKFRMGTQMLNRYLTLLEYQGRITRKAKRP